MSVSRVRENLMHGLTGGGWKRTPATVEAKAVQGKRWTGAPRPTADQRHRASRLPSSATGTRLLCSARSGTMPSNGSRCGCRRRQPPPGLGMGHDPGTAITRSSAPDHPRRNRHPAPALPALAGNGRTPTVKNVGKPCAGEPHARFDGRGLETGRNLRNRASPRPSRVVMLSGVAA